MQVAPAAPLPAAGKGTVLSAPQQQGQAVWRGTPVPAIQLPQLPPNFLVPTDKVGSPQGPEPQRPALQESPGTPSDQHQGTPWCLGFAL